MCDAMKSCARMLCWTLAVWSVTAVRAADNDFLPLVGNAQFNSALSSGDLLTRAVHDFQLQQHPVTNAEYLNFVLTHPQWQRDHVATVFASADYLSHWQAPTELGTQALPLQPVTRVSWFAAAAYCESQQARLPTWVEWELAAAASGTSHDARTDTAWRQRILDWYARPLDKELAMVAQSAPDINGLYDLHGLVWEWVLDFNSLMNSNEAQQFCGSGALTLRQKDNYAVLMRVALLSSLRAADTTHALGFRCARDVAMATP